MLMNMKKEKNIKRKKTPIMVFLITFALVVGIGLIGMLGYLLVTEDVQTEMAQKHASEEIQRENEENGEQTAQNLLWEAIPEKEEQRNEEDTLSPRMQALKEKRVQEITCGGNGVVSFGFVGDILFDDEYACMAMLLSRGTTIENGISEALLAGMHDVDVMMANNEFPYTDRGTPLENKAYTFRADTSSVSYLKDMGIDVVSIANNHAYDFGEIGFLDTLATLEDAGMPYVGGGRNIKEASEPIYFVAEDVVIALVSATQIERLDNPDTKGATENSAGVFRCLNPERLCETVKEAKENSDFVIVYIHWGTENEAEPDWAQLDQAPKLAEAGADLIVGAHPHCLQGIEYYGNTPVVYSLGNFWFNSKTLDTGFLKVDISKNGIEKIQLVPAMQKDCKTDYVYGTEKERILSYVDSLSPGVSIDGEGYISKE